MRIFLMVFITLISESMAFLGSPRLSHSDYVEVRGKLEVSAIEGSEKEVQRVLKEYEIDQEYQKRLLQMATGDKNLFPYNSAMRDAFKICNPKTVGAILKAPNVKETYVVSPEEPLAFAVKNNCKGSVLLLVDHLKVKEVAKVGREVKINDLYLETDDDQRDLGAIYKAIMEKLEPFCKKGEAWACQPIEHMKSEVVAFDRRYRARNYAKTPSGQRAILENEICSNFKEARDRKLLIREEKDKGKISGYVDAVKMKKWGDRAYEFEKKHNQGQALYEKKYGRRYPSSRCN